MVLVSGHWSIWQIVYSTKKEVNLSLQGKQPIVFVDDENSSLRVNLEFWKIYVCELDSLLILKDFSSELDTDSN